MCQQSAVTSWVSRPSFEWGFSVRQLGEFAAQLGATVGAVDTRVLERVAHDWGIVLPQEVLEVLSAYGDSIISDQIVLHGPRTLAAAGAYRGPRLTPGLEDHDEPEALPQPAASSCWPPPPTATSSACVTATGPGGR